MFTEMEKQEEGHIWEIHQSGQTRQCCSNKQTPGFPGLIHTHLSPTHSTCLLPVGRELSSEHSLGDPEGLRLPPDTFPP